MFTPALNFRFLYADFYCSLSKVSNEDLWTRKYFSRRLKSLHFLFLDRESNPYLSRNFDIKWYGLFTTLDSAVLVGALLI